MKSTNQLYFVEKQEKDFDNECGNGETSFASHRSEMRDQGIQSGNGNIRQIVPKRKVKSNPSTKIKQSDHYKYVSPFIQSAELKAKQRAEQYLTAKRREKQRNDWNSNIAPTGSLFDPTIHKQEIFKLQPRNRSSTENIQNVVHRNFANSQGHEDASAALTVNQLNNGRARMTMRSSGVRTFIYNLFFCLFVKASYLQSYSIIGGFTNAQKNCLRQYSLAQDQ